MELLPIVSLNTVLTTMRFISPKFPSFTKPIYYTTSEVPVGFPQPTILRSEHEVRIYDVRGAEEELGLDKNGFKVIKHETRMTYQDFEVDSKIEEIYIPECEALLKDMTGATTVQVFNYLVRRRELTEKPTFRQPGFGAHVDQSPNGAKARLQRHISCEVELNPKRYQIFNLWRPLRGPVRDAPLAFADSRTVDWEADAVVSDLKYPDGEETLTFRHNPAQKWYYLRDQCPNEPWVFKCFDSWGGESCSRAAPHSSFLDGKWDRIVDPRQSIEIRALAVYL